MTTFNERMTENNSIIWDDSILDHIPKTLLREFASGMGIRPSTTLGTSLVQALALLENRKWTCYTSGILGKWVSNDRIQGYIIVITFQCGTPQQKIVTYKTKVTKTGSADEKTTNDKIVCYSSVAVRGEHELTPVAINKIKDIRGNNEKRKAD